MRQVVSKALSKKSLIKKALQVGGSTLISRLLGLIRTMLEIKYFGVGALSDAFWAAYRIPNMLRKVFAEGALSAAFLPQLVSLVKDEQYGSANKLMTLTLMVIEAIVLGICFIVMAFPRFFILLTASGFAHKPVELQVAVMLLRIIMFFIFFISSSALLGGALQARHAFMVPALGPALLNCVFICGLGICWYYALPVWYFAFIIVAAGLVQFTMHGYAYFRVGFTFAWPDQQSRDYLRIILVRLIPCIITVGATELSNAIDSNFASYLPVGAMSLIQYAASFMRIPFGVISGAFATILLPHFSRVSLHAPRRLSFYFFEAAKLVVWVTLPIVVLMCFFSHEIFSTLFLSQSFILAQVQLAAQLLNAFLLGLFFFSINKLLVSIYYALRSTWLPAAVTCIGALSNIIFNKILVNIYGAVGLALGTSLSALIQTLLFIVILRSAFNFDLYIRQFIAFFCKASVQLIVISELLMGMYLIIARCIAYLPTFYACFFLQKIGLWLWVGPLALALLYVLYKTRRFFALRLYFLD
jgi:putative peptidoglycan lipid II flippase